MFSPTTNLQYINLFDKFIYNFLVSDFYLCNLSQKNFIYTSVNKSNNLKCSYKPIYLFGLLRSQTDEQISQASIKWTFAWDAVG